jgi:hypothetical protein
VILGADFVLNRDDRVHVVVRRGSTWLQSQSSKRRSRKYIMKLVVLGVASFLGTSVAAENDGELSQKYSTCLDSANGVTFAILIALLPKPVVKMLGSMKITKP